jgi:hypothetical protein
MILRNKKIYELLHYYKVELNAPLIYSRENGYLILKDYRNVKIHSLDLLDADERAEYDGATAKHDKKEPSNSICLLPYTYYLKVYDHCPHRLIVYNNKKVPIGFYDIVKIGAQHFVK